MADPAQPAPAEKPEGEATTEQQGQHLYAYQRVGQYSPVQHASERAGHFYSAAKELNPHVKSGLEKAEAGLAGLASIVWPYVEPALEKIDPVAQHQLNTLEGVYEASVPAVEQKFSELHSRAYGLVAAADKSLDNVLPAEEPETSAEEEKELKDAQEKSLRGEIYHVSAKLATRLYARAADNVRRAHAYTMTFAPAPENISAYTQYVEQQKENLGQSLASTQAYILSAVQEAPSAANSKLDELRKTAAVQTAMDMAHSLTTALTNLKSSANYKVPDSITESVNSLTGRLQTYYTSLREGDDKLQVTATLRQLSEESVKAWEAIKGNVMARVAQTPGPVVTEPQSTQ